MAKIPLIDRFNTKYVIDPITDCWIWTTFKDADGYGRFSINNTNVRAHRFSYKHFKGPIPDNLFVCHTCDCPSCVNPNHLFLGTHQDNMDDRNQKNRQATNINPHPGEGNGRSILTESDVIQIKQHLQNNYRGLQTQLAQQYNVSIGTINHIKTGYTWTHLL